MKIIISGIVQGVGFRPFIYRVANKLNLSGYIQNRGDGIVEIYISGEKRNLDSFLSKIKEEKPILAKYDDIKIVQDTDRKDIKYNDFSIIKSSTKINTIGSPIQPDVGICNKCINDFSYGKRRNNYYFISCTDCGPKYSILENFPYDRINTTMNNFPICIKCNNEYNDPNNRLFHYELISCTDCGPKFSLIDRYGNIVTGEKDPILSCAKLITEGNIIAAKGIGGFHIITSATNSNPIIKVRNKKNRKNKPFAVMSRDLNSTKSFAIINEIEKRILSSSSRPIVLLNKNKKYYLSPAISSLNTIGVMLPYTGFHISLLNFVQDHVLVMTSGNDTNMPIIKDENKAIKSLSDCADYFLIHDRKIFTPCDDSILKIIENVPILIRG
ncbi:MAG: Sua5/YciO/YrdC/YwlC family protein, partial [Nitrososphaeraceae archaeon]